MRMIDLDQKIIVPIIDEQIGTSYEVEMTVAEMFDKFCEALLYIADCMVAVNDMQSQHNCNDCGLKLRCAYVPQPGQPVRWNCPLWKSDNEKDMEG